MLSLLCSPRWSDILTFLYFYTYIIDLCLECGACLQFGEGLPVAVEGKQPGAIITPDLDNCANSGMSLETFFGGWEGNKDLLSSWCGRCNTRVQMQRFYLGLMVWAFLA